MVMETREPVAPKLLGLAYGPDVPRAKLARMERVGRRLGLPLEALERFGQDEALCDAFLEAAGRGAAAAFAARPEPAWRRLLVR